VVKGGVLMQVIDQYHGKNFSIYNGDTAEAIKEIPDNSIHYQIFSPPFASLYTYSNSDRDLGNCKTHGEFFGHYKFIISEQYRILIPGRNLSFHCMNLPTSKERDGYIGIEDFRGELIKLHQDAGFIYHSEVCIWKNPVTAMQRTKALGLLHKQIKKDSCMSRQGIADYLVTMRKPGDNPERVTHTNDSFPVSQWQEYASPAWDMYASPIWWDINQSNTLNKQEAREEEDGRHICPLQLDVIERALTLWTNPGDIVFTPFLGIGSEVYQAVKTKRRGIGIELKESYFNQAVKYCSELEVEDGQINLFTEADNVQSL
jgi:DNA modification methylase